MVLDDKRVEQLCKAIEKFPMLWDPTREDFKLNSSQVGKKAKKQVLQTLIDVDAQFWASYEVGTIMKLFRGFKANYAASLVKIDREQKTKSGQAVDDDKAPPKEYKHAEHLRFLDGRAVGLFGVDHPTTNVPVTGLESSPENEIDVVSSDTDDLALKEAEDDLNTTLGRDEAEAELRVAKKLKLAAADECEILERPVKLSLKNGNRSHHAKERESMKEQGKMLMNGIDKMSSAVARLISLPDPTPPAPPTAVPRVEDEFSTFAKSVEHRLRKMNEEEAMEFMAAVTALMYKPRVVYPSYSAQAGPSYHQL